MWLCLLKANMVEYLATHKLLVFVSFLSVFNLLCYSIPEGYLLKGNAEFYWIIALAVLVSIMIGCKTINIPYTKPEKLHKKIIESKQPYWVEKKWIKIVSSCCGIISLVITIIILSVYCPKTNLGFDYLGAIIAIASLAVAIFVAVQIYHSFNLKRDIDEQNKKLLDNAIDKFTDKNSALQNELAELKEMVDEKCKDCKSYVDEKIQQERSVSILNDFYQMALKKMYNKDYSKSFYGFCEVACVANSKNETTFRDRSIDWAQNILEDHGEEIKSSISKELSDSVLNKLKTIQTDEAKNLVTSIENLIDS